MRGVSWLTLLLCVSLLTVMNPAPPGEDTPAAAGVYTLTAEPLVFIPPSPTPKPTPEPTAAPTPEPTPEPVPAVAVPLLVGPQNPLPADYIPEDLIPAFPGSSMLLTRETAEAFDTLRRAVYEAGIYGLRLHSAYRCYDSQEALFRLRVNALRYLGDQAEDAAARVVARPGTSEHQAGLAVDVTTESSLHQSFGSTPAGIWLAGNAWRFGFVLRYPRGKTEITGVIYEPWHFRYVGLEDAAAMYELGLCLEEYIEYLYETAP